MTQNILKLNGFSFAELLTAGGLARLDQQFLAYLKTEQSALYEPLLCYRRQEISEPKVISELILACAPIVEHFIAELFTIEASAAALREQTLAHDPIFQFKKFFVQRQAKRRLNQSDSMDEFSVLNQWVTDRLLENKLTSDDRQLMIAQLGVKLLSQGEQAEAAVERLTDWCVSAMTSTLGRQVVADWEMFTQPAKLDFNNLVEAEPVADDALGRYQGKHFRHRDGFNLTDKRMSQRQVMDEVHYCVYCHKNSGDFCSHGFPVKKNEPDLGLKINPVGEQLTGCPLEEKISEMHSMKKSGYGIAALAIVMIDNPMCPATGHRICNDCMKACIYQKQQPVDIPQAETRVLTDVLDLPWGVEIYDLLTRWNPLRSSQWCLQPYNGLKVLVMGMGPAGFTLAHHLLMSGFAVVGADGLKIEPLPERWLTQPIQSWGDLQEQLSDRVMSGFGGVAEYGITVRWDKNFLKLIYINLMRSHYFQVLGGVRFGGALTVEDAWQLGFDHVSVAVGAGLPKELAIPNSLAPGMRQANDFLMALQLTGAAKQTSLANLQVRLPAVVIGGGLTGVDTATEVQAYYITQVEKVAKRYHILVDSWGEAALRQRFSAHQLIILDEFLQHAAAVRQERQLAYQQQREPDLIALIRRWGGVSIAYRRSMQESPAYRRNPEELTKALEEGIYYAEGLEPTATVLDEYGHVKALKCRWRLYDKEGNWHETDEEQLLAARSVFVATGARFNVAYEFEHRGSFVRRSAFEYQRYELIEEQLQLIETQGHVKSERFGPFTSYQYQDYRVSFLGDTHPVFHGSVVNAIASAKRTYPAICQLLESKLTRGERDEYVKFNRKLNDIFKAKVESVRQLASTVIEVVVRAPWAASKFEAGQFYRLQNYERSAALVADTQLQIEGLALLGIRHHEDPELLRFIALQRGVSSRLLDQLRPGEAVALMGPAGARKSLKDTADTIMIIGGSMAAIYLLSLVTARDRPQFKILFIACFAPDEPVFCRDELEAAADHIIWVENDLPKTLSCAVKTQQLPAWGKALQDYADSEQAIEGLVDPQAIEQIVVVGSSAFLYSMQQALQSTLQPYFQKDVAVLASVYGPMQCMLKGVCAQCLQWQLDPKTGERTKAVYACSWQHQPLEKIDIDHIDQRLIQNQCQETLSSAWLDYLQQQHPQEFNSGEDTEADAFGVSVEINSSSE